jgi:hypothetical protein
MRTPPHVPVVEEANWFWPLVLIPYSIEDAHTRTFTGREVVSDIKATLSRVRVVLTSDELRIIGRMTGRTHLTIPRRSIVSTTPSHRHLLRLVFDDEEWSRLGRALTSGQPSGDRNVILLNSRNRTLWMDALNAPPARGEGSD